MEKIKALISGAFSFRLVICAFVFAYACCRFSYVSAQIEKLKDLKQTLPNYEYYCILFSNFQLKFFGSFKIFLKLVISQYSNNNNRCEPVAHGFH